MGWAAWLAACSAEKPPYVVDLSGEHRFYVGDDPTFARPDFDDASWSTLALPATWRVRTIREEVIGWHRIRFALDNSPPGRLALDLGAIGWSDEVYVNGRRIGGTGRFDRLPKLGQFPRLYPLPDDALGVGPNVIAIRIRGVPLGINGLFARRIGIGDQLALTRVGAESPTPFFEGLILGFLVVSWLVVAFFPKRGRAGRATLFLLGTIMLALVMLWLLSVTCRRAGTSPEVGANVLVAVLTASGTIYWAFVAMITRGLLPMALAVPLVANVVLAVLVLAWPATYAAVIVAGMTIGTWALAVLFWLIYGAIRTRVPGAVPIAFSCILPAIGLAVMLFAPDPFLGGLPTAYWGLASTIACAILALTRHVHEMNRQVQRATEYSLEAHTRERGRLARDLHDGLGQLLALLKLQMQRMSRKHAGEPVQQAFDESVDQVTVTLDELRRIARDLRPAPLQDRSFSEALHEYAEAIARRSGFDVVVEGEYRSQLPEGAGDELYRIAQECLTNCLKHSNARRLVVTLAEVGDRYCLTVTDDGRGIPDAMPVGLGLTTIRERSELLGGTCTITSQPGGGTQIAVAVPREVIGARASPHSP